MAPPWEKELFLGLEVDATIPSAIRRILCDSIHARKQCLTMTLDPCNCQSLPVTQVSRYEQRLLDKNLTITSLSGDVEGSGLNSR